MMPAVYTYSPASTEDEAVRKLQTFPKEVIIEGFLSVCLFLRVGSVVSECKEIQRDRPLNMLLKRNQRCILANQLKGDIENYYEWRKKMKKLTDEQNIIEKKIDRLLTR